MTEMQTDRLILRPLDMADAPDIARLIGDWEVIRWLTAPPWPYAVEDAEWFVGDESAQGSYAITMDGEFCGVAGIGIELGYWLGRSFQGQGIMTEAARAIVDAHFGAGGGDLVSGYLEGNAASANVLRKLGFQPTARRTRFSNPRGCEVPSQEMILTRQGWQANGT